MTDSCATCFYYRDGACHFNAPFPNRFASVESTDWCGNGADVSTGLSFSAVVNSVPGPGASAGHSVYSGPSTPPAFPAVDGDLYFYYNVGTLQEIWAMNITWTLIANHFPP